ncbi:XRE family transcriptional regulator [Martelella sp. HB161492]|uniref:short-chain fatty acyl-CoA regulator family protein n=1 Tax=Martelella sp. HB161492 TaxID=2720726 RepID=UPI001590763D
MAENKIFAGPRLRRVRNSLELTQTAMAEALAISPSYLNLIERNQRPLTVQLLMKLAAVYDVDITALKGESGGAMAELKAVFSDPLLVGELPGDQELLEVAEAAPNAAVGIVKLYRAYREQAERLSDLAALLAREGHETQLAAARLPYDAVRETLARRPFFFDALDREAEALHQALGPGDDIAAALKAWLRQTHGIAVRLLPADVMSGHSRRFDRHTMRLFISGRLPPADQMRELAIEAVFLAMPAALEAAIQSLSPSGDEERRLLRYELARYAALALLMPYGAFVEAARRVRFDIDLLRSRFAVSFEQAATRLVSLQRPENAGLPFFLMEVDQAGHVLRRLGAKGFPQEKFGGECPKLGVHDAFSSPGRIDVARTVMADGTAYLTLSRTLDGPQAGFAEPVRRTAILIGLSAARLDDVVYAEALPGGERATEIGPACRLCERSGCLARAEPPLTRPLALDDMTGGLSRFDF